MLYVVRGEGETSCSIINYFSKNRPDEYGRFMVGSYGNRPTRGSVATRIRMPWRWTRPASPEPTIKGKGGGENDFTGYSGRISILAGTNDSKNERNTRRN